MGTAAFSVWNCLGKEIQSHTFPQSVVWHLSFSFHFFRGWTLDSFPHLKRRDLQKTIITPTTHSSAPNVISLADGFRAYCKQYHSNSAPTSLKMLRCLRSPSSSPSLLKRACVTACKESRVQETSRLALAVRIHHTRFTMRSLTVGKQRTENTHWELNPSQLNAGKYISLNYGKEPPILLFLMHTRTSEGWRHLSPSGFRHLRAQVPKESGEKGHFQGKQSPAGFRPISIQHCNLRRDWSPHWVSELGHGSPFTGSLLQ